MEKGKKRLLTAAAIIIILAVAVYFSFFYIRKFSDTAGFNGAMSKCIRGSFVNDAEDAAWLYTIKKARGSFFCFVNKRYCDECVINVKLLQVKKGTSDISILEDKDMECSLPYSYVGSPQADISRCHGELKEGMQNLIINKMHAYIVSNLGQINEELTRAL